MEKKKIPYFKNEDEEREFWATHDSTEYIDWSTSKRVRFSNLKPSGRVISIRMPEFLIAELKFLANKKGIPYQSLTEVYLAERVKEELSTVNR